MRVLPVNPGSSAGSGARIEVVNQSANAIQHFQRLFRGTDVKIEECGSGDDCIAEFVEGHVRRD